MCLHVETLWRSALVSLPACIHVVAAATAKKEEEYQKYSIAS